MEEKSFDFKGELKAIGMTQKDFATYVNVNQNTVSRWLRGDLPMPKWVHLLVCNYKKAKILDDIQNVYLSRANKTFKVCGN